MTKHLLMLLCVLGCQGAPPLPEPADAGGVPLDAGVPVDAGQPPPCSGRPGLFREQTLEVGGQVRHYLLYVPASYACQQAAPLLLDFHGAYGGVTPPAEEVYTLDGAMAAADRDGFILVRPRSLTVPNQGLDWHYWDGAPGDVPANLQLVHALLDEVEARYHVAKERVYALGFSNGTQMALRLLAEAQPVIRGAAIVGGGYWTPFALPSSLADRGRVAVFTGYRDYHYTLGVPPLEQALGVRGYPMERYFKRELMSGHELFAWQYPEAFAWLDRGEKPLDAGPLPSGWVDAGFGGVQALAITPGLAPWLASGVGAAWKLELGVAEALPALPAATPATGICVAPSGTQFAAVKGQIARRAAGASSWSRVALPVSPSEPVAMGIDVVCLASGRVLSGGFSGFASDDDGLTWSPLFMGYPGYGSVQVNRLHATPSGRVVAAGDYYLGTSLDGVQFGVVSQAQARLLAVASFGAFTWAAGTSGVLARSADDGSTWTFSSLGPELDIYDLVAVSKDVVVAVGARGLMLVTHDGGGTWARVETGQTGMFTGVRRSGAALDKLTVFGESGRVFELPVP